MAFRGAAEDQSSICGQGGVKMNVGSVSCQRYSACEKGSVKIISDGGIAEHGRKSRLNQRDVLELSVEDKFHNFYSDYGGYANPEEFGNSLRYRYSHTIVHTSTWFFEAAGEALQMAKGEKEDYDGTDVVNAYGFAYAKLYDEIEKRYETSKEQWFDIDGTPFTKEKEMEYLNAAYENAVAFQVASAKVMAGLRHLNGQIPKVPEKDVEELEKVFHHSREQYRDLYRESRATGEPMAFRRFSFGNSVLLALLV